MGIEGVEIRHMEAATDPDRPPEERALAFDCGGERLYGILSLPGHAASGARGVLVVVGGPQYRAGSHRQFTLLARDLAQDGVPVLRFDYRGMGDSEGTIRPFDDVEDDLRAAIDAFMAASPGLREVVLWGLCELAIIACDLAEVIGTAIALKLLFGIPLLAGAITGRALYDGRIDPKEALAAIARARASQDAARP